MPKRSYFKFMSFKIDKKLYLKYKMRETPFSNFRSFL